MHIIGLMLARNEDWIIGLSARAALEWCNSLLIFNHASTDRTAEIVCELANEYPLRVRVLYDPDPVWKEMQFRNEMLREAREWKGPHQRICVIDADEVLSGNLLGDPIQEAFKTLEPAQSLEPPWPGIRGDIYTYHANGVWGTNWVSLGFLDQPHYHWTAQKGYDFHHRRPMGAAMSPVRPWKQGEGGIMHLQFVNDRRLRAKQAAYKMQEVLRWPAREPVSTVDKRYNPAVYGTPGDIMGEVPESWWTPYLKWMPYLNVDSEPWQEKQCKQWMAEYGKERFKGLDLFGVV